MRKNLIDMLDELSLNEFLQIDSCFELFGEREELLHTTYVARAKYKNITICKRKRESTIYNY